MKSIISGCMSSNMCLSAGVTYSHILPLHYRNKLVKRDVVKLKFSKNYLTVSKLLIHGYKNKDVEIWSFCSENKIPNGVIYQDDVHSYYYNHKCIPDSLFLPSKDERIYQCIKFLYPNYKINSVIENNDEIGKLYKAEIELCDFDSNYLEAEDLVRYEDYKLYLYALDSPTRNFCNE
jgi:hypothetical protein